jgi:hypothetical protein
MRRFWFGIAPGLSTVAQRPPRFELDGSLLPMTQRSLPIRLCAKGSRHRPPRKTNPEGWQVARNEGGSQLVGSAEAEMPDY